MIIETKAYFRRLARSSAWFLIGALSLGGVAAAQAPPAITTGSVVPLEHPEFNQIYQFVYWQGYVLALDTAQSVLYQMSPGSTTFTVDAENTATSGPANAQGFGDNGSYWNMGMAIDNEGDLYIGDRYSTTSTCLFYRIPFQNGTWSPTANDAWGCGIVNSNGTNLVGYGSGPVAFLDSGKGDGSGAIYWMTTEGYGNSEAGIYMQQVGAGGSLTGEPPATAIVTNLTADQGRIAVDPEGDVLFVENPAADVSDRYSGVLFIENGNTNLVGETASGISPITPSSYNGVGAVTNKFDGVTLDPAGNLYLTSESGDGYGGTWNGVLMIPNACGGGAAGISSPGCFSWSSASYISPVGSNSSVMVDPRGFLWIPSYGVWSYLGSNPYGGGENSSDVCTGGACNFVLWALGSDNLGAEQIGQTTSTAGSVFVNFNDSVTLSNIGFSQPGLQPGSTGEFAATSSNPYPDPTATSPAVACGTGTGSSGPGPYATQTSCPIWINMTPSTAGTVSGQLVLTGTDGNGNTVTSTTYLSGVGEGPMAALLGIPQQTSVAAAGQLEAPSQVAVDTLGNVYVADSQLGEILEYSVGSSSPTVVAAGLTHPTGVAVDGSGDLYIGASGSVYEIPYVNGALDKAAETTLVTSDEGVTPTGQPMPLGNTLNLAVDGSGDVYVADPDDSQVVEINNPQLAVAQDAYTVVGTDFQKPVAVAVDSSGDLFVADSEAGTLYEITSWGEQNPIDTSLQSPTGLAVEPSGSVDVTESTGVWRIPYLNGNFSVTSAMQLDSVLASPTSVAIDTQGNLYVTDDTGGTPGLYQLSVNGMYDFGNVGVGDIDEADVSVYNVGNASLSFANDTPSFGGADASEFSLVQPTATECDTTGASTVESGSSCAFGVQILPTTAGSSLSGNMSIPSSAINGTLAASFTANVVNLESTSTSISLSTATTTYPGSATVTVNILPQPNSSTPANTNVPDGTVTLTLTSSASGSAPITETAAATGSDTGTTATFNLTDLPGGAYTVNAKYAGNANFSNSAAPTPATLTVNPAPATISVPEPTPGSSVTLANGVYYVLAGSQTSLTATVTSAAGTPAGTVTFMNGTQLADPTQSAQDLNANGQVTFTLENLQAGAAPGGTTYNLTAVYSGDTDFAGAQVTVSVQIIPASVLITASPASLSAAAGTPVSSTLTLESLVGFANTGVNITCDIATVPSYAECTFNNPQPALTSGGTTTTVVTLTTNIPTNIPSSSSRLPARSSPFALAGVFGLGLLGLGLRKRKLISRGFFQVVCLVLLLAGSMAGFTGCTNSSYTHTPPAPNYVTPSGTYPISIVVTDESTGQQYSVPFTLPVTITSASAGS